MLILWVYACVIDFVMVCSMGDRVLLKFWYKGKDIDVVVDDIDKISLIDLVIEYWEKAESENVQYPKYAEFTYMYRMKHIQLNTDMDLLNMFSNLPRKKEIYISVGSVGKPTTIIQSALSLRSTQKSANNHPIPPKPASPKPASPVNPSFVPPRHQNRKKLTPRKKKVAPIPPEQPIK